MSIFVCLDMPMNHSHEGVIVRNLFFNRILRRLSLSLLELVVSELYIWILYMVMDVAGEQYVNEEKYVKINLENDIY
ncbi:hypothetical protein HanIR_Chr05g0210661 [Helianthus annuus]|nr:hypothetical protein HanIR_Chr05g0210661 [Helianthus annuus]